MAVGRSRKLKPAVRGRRSGSAVGVGCGMNGGLREIVDPGGPIAENCGFERFCDAA